MGATIIPIPMEARIIIPERAHLPTPLPAVPLRLAVVAAAKANLPANNSQANRSRGFQLSSEGLPFPRNVRVYCTSIVVVSFYNVVFVSYYQAFPRPDSFALCHWMKIMVSSFLDHENK
jgi:hypothetical protein